MANIDWEQLFISNHVQYVTSGENVKKGNINIRCPFCNDDPSHHMGISLIQDAWGCWRDSSHRGRRPHRLLNKLLGMSYAEVDRLVGDERRMVPDGFAAFASGLTNSFRSKLLLEHEEKQDELLIPRSFRFITKGTYQWKHVRYLRERGVSLDCARHFRLMYCDQDWDRWSSRIIIPFFEADKIVTWTARAVREWQQPRYKAATPDEDNAMRTTDVVYNFDNVADDDSISKLVVTEGAFDAINVHWCGRDSGIGAVALSTTSISERQLVMLLELINRRRMEVLIAFDDGADSQAECILYEIAPFTRARRYTCPVGYNDPAELPRREVIRMGG